MAELQMQEESSTPATPSSGKWKIYPKASGLYLLDDLGVEIGPMVPRDGWIPVYDSWTYASATTINVPTDATLLYQKGWGIRFKQGGAFKYMYMITVAATLLTVTGGSDYTVANAAITDIAVCPNPGSAFGFPVYFTFASTLTGTAGSAGTFAETVQLSRFGLNGTICHSTVAKLVTNKGSWSGDVLMALPIAGASVYSAGIHFYPSVWANGAAPNAPKAFPAIYNNATMKFLDLFNSAFFTWADMATSDWFAVHLDYEI
jgi:hypothetical protein